MTNSEVNEFKKSCMNFILTCDGIGQWYSHNIASERYPEYNILVEKACVDGSVKRLLINAPYLDIHYNEGFSEDELRETKKDISNSVVCIDNEEVRVCL